MTSRWSGRRKTHPKKRKILKQACVRLIRSARMSQGLEHKVAANAPIKYRSEGERRIAKALDQYGIPFIYEPSIQILYQNQLRSFRPDFYLPSHNLYVEYFGRVGNQDYDQRTETKLTAYAANNLNILPLFPWHLVQNWPNELLDRLHNPTALSSQQKSTRQYPGNSTSKSFYRRFPPTPSRSYRRSSSRTYR